MWLLTGNNQASERKSVPKYAKTPLMIFDKIGVVNDLMCRTSTADSFLTGLSLKQAPSPYWDLVGVTGQLALTVG